MPPWPTNSVTFIDGKANIHKQVSLGKGSHCLKRLFSPACLSRHIHPSANEISTALSSCGYTGISPITSNKQPADELEFRAYENMNLKLKLAPRNPPMLSKRVLLKPSCLADFMALRPNWEFSPTALLFHITSEANGGCCRRGCHNALRALYPFQPSSPTLTLLNPDGSPELACSAQASSCQGSSYSPHAGTEVCALKLSPPSVAASAGGYLPQKVPTGPP